MDRQAGDGGCTTRSWTSTPRGVSKVVLLRDSDSVLSPLGIFKHCVFFLFLLRLDDSVRLRETNVRFVVIRCRVDFCPFGFVFLVQCDSLIDIGSPCCRRSTDCRIFFFLLLSAVYVGFSFFLSSLNLLL
jgi:hypothetical protein